MIDVPAFRWFLLSMTGNWSSLQMQQVVRGWLVYQLTGSFAALGGVALANAGPRLGLALYGGVIADRVSRRYVVQAGQAVSMLQAAVIAGLLFSDQLRFEHLLVSAVLQGIANSFSQPARQAMIPEIVGKERLTNAFALNASAMNTSRLLAPALGGALLAVIGPEWVYLLMTGLYALAILAMVRVPAAPPAAARIARPEARRGRGGISEIADAFRYLRTVPVLMMLLGVHLFIVTFSMPYQRLLPGFVDEVLSDSPEQTAIRMGLLLTLTGMGALVGSLAIASIPNRHRGALLLGSTLVLGIALLAFSMSTSFTVSAVVVVLLGVGMSGRQALTNVLIQTHVSDEYRGRISSIQMMQMGLTSFGTFGIGILAAVIGPQMALGGAAVALIVLSTAVFALVPNYRNLQ
ncbi:MAG: MFS transporter [Dehalococcoidia bacterium]